MPEIRDVIPGGSVEIQPGCGKEFWGGVICRCPGRVFGHSGLNLLSTSLHMLHPPKCCLWSGCTEPTQLLEKKGRTLNLREGGLVERLDLNLFAPQEIPTFCNVFILNGDLWTGYLLVDLIYLAMLPLQIQLCHIITLEIKFY